MPPATRSIARRFAVFAPLLSWRPEGSKFRVVAGALLVLFAGYAAVFLVVTARRLAVHPASGDFFALWSAARFVTAHPAAQAYDAARLHAAQLAMGMDPKSDYPFPYPPFFLLALWPIGHLAYLPAYGVVIGSTLLLYLRATVGGAWRSPTTVAVALVAPATTITVVAGQAGFLFAALLIGGFRLLGRLPVIAGILFGLLSYKPQLGILVPVGLIAVGAWRSMAAAAATIAALVAVSAAVFGPAIWLAWAHSLLPYEREFASASGKVGHLMPTVSAALMQLGATPRIAGGGQFAVAIAAAAAVWHCFRLAPGPLATASLLVAMFLATPHALVYDMPPVTSAVLWLIAERQRAGAAFGTGEVLVMIIAMIAPVALVAGEAGPVVAVPALALLLVVIVRRCRRVAATRDRMLGGRTA
jgi:alpha-1,2-mannosyltransferase